MIRSLIELLVRSAYRQGWDDATRRFAVTQVVADLKFMQSEQDRQVLSALHFVQRDLESDESTDARRDRVIAERETRRGDFR